MKDETYRIIKTAPERNGREARTGGGRDLALAPVESPVSDANREDAIRLLYQRKYTVPQAARILNIGETKLRKMIRKGVMPVLDLDGKFLVLEQDLEAFLSGRHGVMKETEKGTRPKLAPLPAYVQESDLLRKTG